MWPAQLLFSFLLISKFFSLALISKPGCPDRCGDLQIPYPFGVGPKCSHNPYFNLHCSTYAPQSRAYLTIKRYEVLEINTTYIRVTNPYVLSVCYNQKINVQAKGTEYGTLIFNLSGSPYSLSDANMLTYIGCDDMLVHSNGGCTAFCADKQDSSSSIGYCPQARTLVGNGCCWSDIKQGTQLLTSRFVDLSGKLQRARLFPCSSAFIQENAFNIEEEVSLYRSVFSYDLRYLANSTAMLDDDWASTSHRPVMRLNWKAGAENCNQAKSKASTYACRSERSLCIDNNVVDVAGGYTCACMEGYTGNPYLPQGCQAIPFSSSMAKLGCQDNCGGISILFPFGVGPDCYLEPSFEVVCNTSSNPPTAYLPLMRKTQIKFLNLSTVLVRYENLGWTCYGSSGATEATQQKLSIDLSGTQFSLSPDNTIAAVGCNDLLMAVVDGGGNGSSISTSVRSTCQAMCSDNLLDYARCPFARNWYMPGDGCCRALVPRGTTYLEAYLIDDGTGRWPRGNTCSYAFVEYPFKNDIVTSWGYPFLNYSTSTIPSAGVLLSETESSAQLVSLDWRVGTVKCEEARREPATFVCGVSTDCVDFDNVAGGYLCKCSRGFSGNPYLRAGCQDMDECLDNTTNACNSIANCINLPGSYQCSCPKGYIGDGRENGTACVPLPPSKMKMMILIGLGSVMGFALLLSLCVLMYKAVERRKKAIERRKEKIIREHFFKKNGGLLLQKQINDQDTMRRVKIFTVAEMEKATNGFSESRILGAGQGTVYKGMLPDGIIVAIKIAKTIDENQLNQFITEVAIIPHLSHRNVVRMLGCCLESEIPMLVYEFIPNGTLYDLIHDTEISFSWKMRLKIATDLADALAYLHSAYSIPIFHRDIKSTNFLLDNKYVARVADFGLSMFVPEDQTHVSTNPKGTFGYMDPESYVNVNYTDKSDVYSFGVVLAELLTGRKAIIYDEAQDLHITLASLFLSSMAEGNLEEILDAQISINCRMDDVSAMAKLAERCMNRLRIDRPNMRAVAAALQALGTKAKRVYKIDVLKTIMEEPENEMD